MAELGTGLTSAFQREHRRISLATMAAFGLLPTILCILGALLVQDFRLETNLRAELHLSHVRRNAVQHIFSLLQDAETSQRGYLLTGDPRYLAPYQRVAQEIPGEIAKLESQAVGPELASTLALDAAGRGKLAELDQTIRLNRSGQSQSALQIVRSNRGKVYMDQIRALVAAMDANAARAVAMQSRDVDATLRRTVTAAVSLGVFFVLTLAVAASIVFTAFRHRGRLFMSLEEVAARQAAVLDSAVDAIVTLNPSGTIETINSAGERMFGYDSATLARRDVRVLLDMGLKCEGVFLDCLDLPSGEGGASAVREGFGIDCNGRRFPIEVALGPMQLEAGTYVVAIVRDISERKRAEEIKNQFISAVSHELRTPLTSITGSLGLLKGGAVPGVPEAAQRLISIAHANSDRLGRLVNDILDIEKIQSGRMPFASEPFDLKVVFRNTVEEMDAYARQYDVKVSLAAPQDAPVWARGDAARIGQVAANLISNAVKFSPEGGTVRIGFGRQDGTVQVSVGDDGPGIPEAFRPRIFARFAQADNSDTRQRGGTGLGLAICKEIVDRQGGQLFFKSAVGEGTRFFVNLPACAAPDEASEQLQMEELRPPPPRVLICEDDLEMCAFVEALVKAEGAQVDLVHSLKQAGAALDQGGHTCALLDLNLPDGNALDFLKTHHLAPGAVALPVVIVSAEERRKLPASGMGLKVIDWVQKPLSPSRLRQALRSALEVSRQSAAEGKPLILHVEDDPDVLTLVADLLKESGQVVAAKTVAAAKHALATLQPNLVILDVGLTDGSGLGLLPFLTNARGGRVPTIVFSAQDGRAGIDSVDAVFTKSQASLSRLAMEAHRLLQAAPPALSRLEETA